MINITIRDVAEAAGVSVATVSRVINNPGSVTYGTRAKVQKIIEELNYQPNLLGRNLRRSETRMVLVLLQNISNPFYSRVVKGIEDEGHKNGYHVMVCSTDLDENREKAYLKLLKNKLVDGIIFMSPKLSGKELTEISKHYPIVQCCEYKEDACVSSVSIDNAAAAYRAVGHLIGLGHRKIGMISSNTRILSEVHREEGYNKALNETGINYDSNLIKYSSYGFKGGLRAAKQFLAMKDWPTAIFAISDIVAIGAVKEIKENRLSVPNDIAVVGFDDTSIASMYDPPLTTVSQPRYDLGCTAMNLLLERIQGNQKDYERIILEHELIIRGSTVSNSGYGEE